MVEATDPLEFIEWGFSSIPLKGQDVSGDSYLIKPLPDGILMAVVDGLGHGYEAAQASKIAVSTLKTYASEPIIPLVMRCHEALRGTRGVVMSIAKLNSSDKMMTWLGVGNIEVMLLKADGKPKISRERLLLRGGTLGYQLPPLRESVVPFMRGDILIFVTDGIRGSFEPGIERGDKAQQIADSIMANFNRGTDDALVLVVQYANRE
ncbi:MAG: SpoIIE family protein phosphatase [Candidatus Methanoperedens sp.]